MEANRVLPFESELLGAHSTADGNRFGDSWVHRTWSFRAARIEWTRRGVENLHVVSSCSASHVSYMREFAASKAIAQFKLLKNEYLTEIRVRESDSRDRITAICLQTNLRRSQWYGSAQGAIRMIEAPARFYIHAIHGSNKNGACQNLGAYFVPLASRVNVDQKATLWVADSPVIGDVAFDEEAVGYTRSSACTVRAIVATIGQGVEHVRFVSPHKYRLYLAVTESPLDEGESLVVLVEGELITTLHAHVVESTIRAIQFKTTLRTTEWFGPVPDPDAVIETRSIEDEPRATHIGGIFVMKGAGCIKSIGVKFYKRKE